MHARKWLIWILLAFLLFGGSYLIRKGQQQEQQKMPPPPKGGQTTPNNPHFPPAPQPVGITEGMLVKGRLAKNIVYSTSKWSPNGRAIAYIRGKENDRGENGDLYLAEFLNGTWKHRLLAKGANYPCWSPDGSRLAFNHRGLTVMEMPKGVIRTLVADDLSDGESYKYHYPVHWSPDGHYLFFRIGCLEWGDSRVYDCIAGKTIGPGLGPANGVWISRNRLLLRLDPDEFEAGDDYLAMYDLTTRKTITLTSKSMGVPVAACKDGSSAYLDDSEGIARFNFATGKAKQVMKFAHGYLDWSPDGTRFAFIDAPSYDEPRKSISLYVGSVADLKIHIVATSVISSEEYRDDGYEFSWSANGKWIAYTTKKGDIMLVKP